MNLNLAIFSILVSAAAAQECQAGDETCLPPLSEIMSNGPKAHIYGRLGVCEGDCDKDAHCDIGLECFQRDKHNPVPGCSGKGEYDYDYCVVPELKGESEKGHLDGPMGMCQGDCDFDHHCADGLICYQREALDAVPGCRGTGKFGFSYCTLPELTDFGMKGHEQGRLGLCEGDCDKDFHCEDGLVCHQRDVFDPVPGCRGAGKYDYDYCILPPLTGIQEKAHDNNPSIGLCQGDCDKDAHCKDGLICHQRDGLEHVPGCEGEGQPAFDYCVLPQLTGTDPQAHKNGPLGMCMGDCDSDDHCENGLVCHQRTGHTHVPGCAGMGEFGFSYCIRAPLSDSGPAAHTNGPIGMCQGDCDTKEHCAEGLECFKRNVFDPIPDCYGEGAYDYDYCTRPALLSKGPAGHKYGPLGLCEGDCDIDEHCEKGLKCFQRTGFTQVPGCREEGEFGFSYCIRPEVNLMGLDAYKAGKLKQCEGHCKNSNHCEDGLECLKSKGGPIPGCLGPTQPYYGYCVPKQE